MACATSNAVLDTLAALSMMIRAPSMTTKPRNMKHLLPPCTTSKGDHTLPFFRACTIRDEHAAGSPAMNDATDGARAAVADTDKDAANAASKNPTTPPSQGRCRNRRLHNGCRFNHRCCRLIVVLCSIFCCRMLVVDCCLLFFFVPIVLLGASSSCMLSSP